MLETPLELISSGIPLPTPLSDGIASRGSSRTWRGVIWKRVDYRGRRERKGQKGTGGKEGKHTLCALVLKRETKSMEFGRVQAQLYTPLFTC
jgi:hypothetical protein